MFHRDILISKHLHLILSRDQYLVQILPHIGLSSLNLGSLTDHLFDFVHKILLIDLHLLDHFQNQAVLHSQQTIKKMLLLYFLIAIIAGNFLTSLYSFHRFLGKFIDVHKHTSYSCSIDTITPVVSTVNR